MNLKPLYDRIVVKLEEHQSIKSETGLVCNIDMSERNNVTMRGTITATGEGRLLQDGKILPLKVKIGDKVLFSKMSGETYSDKDGDFVILSESSILCTLEEDK